MAARADFEAPSADDLAGSTIGAPGGPSGSPSLIVAAWAPVATAGDETTGARTIERRLRVRDIPPSRGLSAAKGQPERCVQLVFVRR